MEILLKGFFTVSNFMHFLGYAVTVTSCKRLCVSRSVIHTAGLSAGPLYNSLLKRVAYRFFFVDRLRGLVLNSSPILLWGWQLHVGSFIFFFYYFERHTFHDQSKGNDD